MSTSNSNIISTQTIHNQSLQPETISIISNRLNNGTMEISDCILKILIADDSKFDSHLNKVIKVEQSTTAQIDNFKSIILTQGEELKKNEAKIQSLFCELKIAQADLAKSEYSKKQKIQEAVDNHFKEINRLQEDNRHLKTQLSQSETKNFATSSIKGTIGEKEIENYLTQALGQFATVRNVSKEDNGHGLDLECICHDGTHVRIDTKKTSSLGTREITKFHKDVDDLKNVHGAIIFSEMANPNVCGAISMTPQGTLYKTRRGTVDVYYIGRWAVDLLVSAILQISVDRRFAFYVEEMKKDEKKAELIAETKQISNLIEKLLENTSMISSSLTAVAKVNDDHTQFQQTIVPILRNIHETNTEIVSKHTLTSFEEKVQQLQKPRSKPKPIGSNSPKPKTKSQPKSNSSKKSKTNKRKVFDPLDAGNGQRIVLDQEEKEEEKSDVKSSSKKPKLDQYQNAK